MKMDTQGMTNTRAYDVKLVQKHDLFSSQARHCHLLLQDAGPYVNS